MFDNVSLSCQIPGLSAIYAREFPGVKHGVFVEVGANDGYSWSNTWGLAELGWKGLYFEPVAGLAEKCKQRHIRNNVTVCEKAVGAVNGKVLLYTGEGATTFEYVARNDIFGYGNKPDNFIWVDCVTLNKALASEKIPQAFDLLVIDVDGDEVGVLRGLDLDRWWPHMIIIETCKQSANPGWNFNCMSIEARLKSRYTDIYHDHINSIFVRKDNMAISLFQSKRDNLLKWGGWYDCINFVETGTGGGDMVQELYPYFDAVYSIELSSKYHHEAVERFKNVGNVHLWEGDSGEILGRVIPQGRTLYYLDAHYSGGYTAQGSKATPILSELRKLIDGHFTDVILIDDLKFFGGNMQDYPSVKEISDTVKVWQPNLTVEISPDGGGMIAIYPTKRKRDMAKKLTPKIVPPAKEAEVVEKEKKIEPKHGDPNTHKWERPPVLPGGRSA